MRIEGWLVNLGAQLSNDERTQLAPMRAKSWEAQARELVRAKSRCFMFRSSINL